jgi:hypothetical protein
MVLWLTKRRVRPTSAKLSGSSADLDAPAFHPRQLDLKRQRSRDIKVPKGGLSPLAPTRTSVRKFGARAQPRLDAEGPGRPRPSKVMTATRRFAEPTFRGAPTVTGMESPVDRSRLPDLKLLGAMHRVASR